MTTPGVSANAELPGSDSASFAGQLYVPKLSAIEVAVCLAIAVVPIAFDRAMSAIGTPDIKHLPHGTIVVSSWWVCTMTYSSIASFAACFVASAVLMRSGCLRMLDRLQPGHWIVLILATGGILGRIARPFSAISISHDSPDRWAQHTFEAVLCFSVLAVGALFVFAAIRLRDARRWKALLASGTLSVFFWTAPLLLSPIKTASAFLQAWPWCLLCWSVIFVVIALVAVFIDWPRRATRDWPHWLGVSLWTLGSLAALFESLRVVWHLAGH
jgi:hypothetical protein